MSNQYKIAQVFIIPKAPLIMNRRTTVITFILSLFSLVFTNRALSMSNSSLEKPQTRFALKFFFDLFTYLPLNNIVVSPTSVYLALSLLYNGAKETTQNEMSQLLGTQDLTLEQLNQDNLSLQTFLTTQDNKNVLSIANSLWVKTGVDIYPRFIDSLKYFYKAEVSNLDFSNPASVVIINDWVKKNTNNKITQIVDQISSEEVLFLINALYLREFGQNNLSKN